MDEIQQCAQSQINATLKGNPHFYPYHVTVSGNRNLIPVIRPSAQRPALLTFTPASGAPQAAEAGISSFATLKDIEQHRNPRRVVTVSIQKPC
jgi:hypothetical protein